MNGAPVVCARDVTLLDPTRHNHFLHSKLNRKVPEEEAKLIFIQIVLALECLHSKDISHSRINLENIFIDAGSMEVKLGDYLTCDHTAPFFRYATHAQTILSFNSGTNIDVFAGMTLVPKIGCIHSSLSRRRFGSMRNGRNQCSLMTNERSLCCFY
jgi:serine/threonine protein kinase